ncbi:cell division protein ZapD [Aquicella lusitana]|uniref:Cell division protein ZapD n=1 Tax=Aquicella lusitana TaxID=254246 RepID=A0A370GEU6_9COXI|nr:cell division protein ZapD [Aquicella lusitana]RDI41790.1 cell division protein ZapD [Aquicella lusitana]VVC73699.1 Cell division protein ZapD [Aquicella lusitana]
MKESIVYEQPLNEIIRVCLRLEQLFQQIDHQLTDTTELSARNVVAFIINVLHLLDRPDLKAKLAKELTHHLTNLMRYGNLPDIDSKKFNDITRQLDEHARSLIDSSGKIGQRLRDIELFNTLRLHLASPGGGCSFDIPLYHYWLQQPTKIRQGMINDWLGDFSQIKTIITLILDLVRKNAKVDQKTAVHGFHQELLDPQWNLRMVRIGITHDIPAYPEISIGRHFLSVRFFIPEIEIRPTQYTENLPFWVAYCNS